MEKIRGSYADLGGWKRADQIPIVYSDTYNIGFFGVEKFHPFDSNKFKKVVRALQSARLFTRGQVS